MARTIEQKAQMEFIKDPEKVAVIDAGTHIVISFGTKGAYITIDNLNYFGAECIFRVENKTKLVCVTRNGNVVGVIIPEEIQEEEDE